MSVQAAVTYSATFNLLLDLPVRRAWTHLTSHEETSTRFASRVPASKAAFSGSRRLTLSVMDYWDYQERCAGVRPRSLGFL